MSIYHRDKCTKEEAAAFRDEVKHWLDENKLPYKKLTGLTSYNGEVRIHNGLTWERQSKRLVMQKDDVGYFRAHTHISEKRYWPVYRADWGEQEREETKEYLLKELPRLL